MSGMNRTLHPSGRRWLCAIALAAFVCALAAAPSSARSETHLTLAVSGLSEGKLPIYVAEQQGFLKAAGISIDILEFRSGGEVVKAFLGGSADFCICAADHVIILRNRGLDVKILAGLDAHFPNALVAREGSPFTDVESLKGRKIGITSPGSSTDNLLRWALVKAGLDPEKDVDIVSVGTGAPMRAAIETGAVDAGVLGNAEIIDAQRSGRKPNIIADWRTIEAAALNVIVRQDWVDRHRDIARGFLAAIVRAARLIQSDRAVAIAGTKLILPNKDDSFIAALAASAVGHISKDGGVSPVGFANTLETVRLADPSLKPIALDEVNLVPLLQTE